MVNRAEGQILQPDAEQHRAVEGASWKLHLSGDHQIAAELKHRSGGLGGHGRADVQRPGARSHRAEALLVSRVACACGRQSPAWQ